MKKIYQNPEITVIKVQPSQMMAGSLEYGGTTEETSGNAAKSGGFWSDDPEGEDYYD